MSAPTIIEERSDPLEEDERGLSGSRRFTVVARSQLHARALLRTRERVFIGAPWSSPYGEEVDDSAVCRAMTVSQGRPAAPLGASGLYDAEAVYGRRKNDEAVPFGRPIYRKGVTLSEEKADLDADGDPTVNSVDEPFDPGLTRPKPNEQWTVDWWIHNVTIAQFAQTTRPYDGALNLITWQGAAPGSVLCHGITNAEEVVTDDTNPFDPVMMIKAQGVFQFKPEIDTAALAVNVVDKDGNAVNGTIPGFAEIVPDRGYRVRDGVDADGKTIFREIAGKDTNRLGRPVFLDGNGNQLDDDATTVAIRFLMNGKVADFGVLGI